MGYYPVFLDLHGRTAVVVGGGFLAAEKVRGLVEAGASVRLVAPEVGPEVTHVLEELGDAPAVSARVEHLARGFQPADLDGAFLVIAAGVDPETAEAVWREACRRGLPINTVDDVPRCNFIAPSIVRRGDLAVAISTAGKAPALAVRLRQQLESTLGDEHARFLELSGAVRARLAERWPDFETRRTLWYRLVDSDVLELLKRGEEAEARGRFEEILGVAP